LSLRAKVFGGTRLPGAPMLLFPRQGFALRLQPQLSARGIDVMAFLATQCHRNPFGSQDREKFSLTIF
jgi:hypothetical protein